VDNNNINPTPVDSEETSGISLEKAEESTAQSLSPEYNQSSDTQPAFEYQPPVVEAPEPPTVNEIPSQPAQQQPQYQQPQYQQPQYQQPQYQQPQYQQPQYQQPQYQQPQYQQPPQAINQQPYYQYTPVDPALISQQNTTDGFAIASLICSCVGLVSCCTIVPSLLGVIFAAISKAKNDGSRPTGVSTAGLITGIIGLIINIIIVIAMIYAD
jgi:hypothetical protein